MFYVLKCRREEFATITNLTLLLKIKRKKQCNIIRQHSETKRQGRRNPRTTFTIHPFFGVSSGRLLFVNVGITCVSELLHWVD